MRLLCDKVTDRILSSSLLSGSVSPINGLYCVTLPPGQTPTVDQQSYILNGGVEDSGSITTIAWESYAAQAGYQNQHHNYFVKGTDSNYVLDHSSFTIGSDSFVQTTQTGGLGTRCPNAVAIFPPTSPSIDAAIRTTAYAASGVITRVRVWWDLAQITWSGDRYTTYPQTVSQSITQTLTPLDPNAVTVRLSLDNGTTWNTVRWNTDEVVVATGTQIRLCFSTNGTEKIYLLGYGVLY